MAPNYLLVLAFVIFCSLSLAVNVQPRDLNAPLLSSYDYVICGGGISGLVTAMRLTEDPNVSVLVIEAGDPDNYEEFIQVPQFVGTDIGSKYDWNIGTVPQVYLDGAVRPIPQGRALGGGSILNAMCWNRGGQQDYDDWEALGNPGWGWAGMLPYFKKSETYTPAPDNVEEYFLFRENPDVHGYNGPIQVSYPKYFYNQSRNLFLGMQRLGVPISYDVNDGTTAGASFIPTDIDPVNQTRSDARRTYYDPFINRPNFHVMTGQHVTQILFKGQAANGAPSTQTNTGGNGEGTGNTPDDGPLFGDGSTVPPPPPRRFSARQSQDLRARGVQFAANSSAPRQEVTARREVIVACGALHSAQLLQLSGIGPAALLSNFSIPVKIDLPGVGSNLQDHPLVGTFYPYNNVTDSPALLAQNATYNELAREQYYASKTGPWTAGSGNGFAFNSLPSISDRAEEILNSAASQDPAEYLVTDVDASVLRGYTAQKSVLVRTLRNVRNAIYEMLNNNVGSLTVALMKPFSRGTCHITSSDPFVPPAIDPRYGSNPVDIRVYIEALQFNRRLLATPEMVELQPAQFVPTADADEDSLIATIKNGVRTEFHPSCTLAMLPLELGGVVSPELIVYGTQNIRVVDAGIFPIIPAAHLQAVVYAVAEKAADIIRNSNNATSSPSSILSSVAPSSTSRSTANPSGTSSSITATTMLDSTTASMTMSGTASADSSAVFSTTISVRYPNNTSSGQVTSATPLSSVVSSGELVSSLSSTSSSIASLSSGSSTASSTSVSQTSSTSEASSLISHLPSLTHIFTSTSSQVDVSSSSTRMALGTTSEATTTAMPISSSSSTASDPGGNIITESRNLEVVSSGSSSSSAAESTSLMATSILIMPYPPALTGSSISASSLVASTTLSSSPETASPVVPSSSSSVAVQSPSFGGFPAFPTGDYTSKTPEQQAADQNLVRKIIQFLIRYFNLD